jgi:two-component system CheB/CheR fusion protein
LQDLPRPADSNEEDVEPSHLPFPVVGIGASSGGIAALQQLFGHMPANPGMAFVVVLHLSPSHESSLDKILQKVTKLPVMQVKGSTAILPDRVYLIPPSAGLSMNDGQLELTEPARNGGRPVTIDLFFRSLAQAHRERAFCIVLSGSGCDGAQGLGRVKELGGVTFAQSPGDAEFDSMPRQAVATGMVDLVLPVADMPDKLLELWDNARRIQLPDAPDGVPGRSVPSEELPHARDALQAIMDTLRDRTGHDFTQYKRSTVLRRIERRMQVNAHPTLPSYCRFLGQDPDETGALLQDMLIGVTQFFRDREAFESLERALVTLRESTGPRQPIRAWVAACATGEEAYSVAMLLTEEFQRSGVLPAIQVFASDIDQRAISRARQGVYPESIVTDVPPSRLRDHFTKEPQGYRISKTVRDKVTFSTHNVLRDPPFTRLDLVCCRNLMIYLDRSAQLQMLQTFHFALKPGGLLLLGSAESADAVEEMFDVVDKRWRLSSRSACRPARRARRWRNCTTGCNARWPPRVC